MTSLLHDLARVAQGLSLVLSKMKVNPLCTAKTSVPETKYLVAPSSTTARPHVAGMSDIEPK
jgi:hypothetical protein